jgi:hypothetical protein
MTDLKSFMVKGSPMTADMEFIRSLGGEEDVTRLLELLPPDLAEVCREGLDPDLWYPIDLVLGILKAVRQLYFESNPDIFWQMGCFQAAQNIANYYQGFMEAETPERIAAFGKIYWRLIFAKSSVELVSEPGHLEIEVSDFPATSVDLCEVIRGYIQGALEVTGKGKRNLDAKETTCINRGDDRCRFVFDWE